MKPGTFLVFEGLDGSGKSTQVQRLAATLREAGREVVTTAEPFEGSEWGQRIRAMARAGEPLPPEEELSWFWQQRRDHVEQCIRPALARGCAVVCDRYYLSTVAYQGARGLDPAVLLHESEVEFPLPDLVLLLEIDPAEGLRRAGSRGEPSEPVFERQDFLERVAAVFGSLELDYLERIDAAGGPDGVHDAILDALRRRELLE